MITAKKLKYMLLGLIVSQSALCASPEYQQLFNKKNLDGWQHIGDGGFVVENGVLRSFGGMGLLWYTKQKFGKDDVLRVVYKTPYKETNSGIFVRLAAAPKDNWDAVHHAYEVQICDDGSDAFDDYHRTGAIYSFSKSLARASKQPGEWNEMKIALKNQKIIVWLNGIKLNEFDAAGPVPKRLKDFEPKRGERPLYGYIGIQNHDHNALYADSHIYIKEISYLHRG